MIEWLKELEWGDVPTWLSSLGGIGALIAATIAARASLNVLRIESQRDTDSEGRAQRAQADLVAAWLDTEDEDDMNAWHLHVVNSSQIPVYEFDAYIVSAFIWPDDPGIIPRYLAVVAPGETTIPITELLDHIGHHLSLEEWPILRSKSGIHITHDVWIAFRDAAGVEWIRSRTGSLSLKPPGEFRPPEHPLASEDLTPPEQP